MSDSPDSDTADAASRALAEADALATTGQARQAVERLVTLDHRLHDPVIEARLVQLRHDAMTVAATPIAPPTGTWPIDVPDRFDAAGIPEVSAADLDADVIRSAMAHRGSLLVRGLLDADAVALLRDDLVRTFAAAEQADAGRPVTETTPWYVPFSANEGYSFGRLERGFTHSLGGVLSVESPRTLFDVIETFKAAGLGELLEQYFGEWPAISAKKSTLSAGPGPTRRRSGTRTAPSSARPPAR